MYWPIKDWTRNQRTKPQLLLALYYQFLTPYRSFLATQWWLTQFQALPIPPGICWAFVILFWKSYNYVTVGSAVRTKTPRWGLKIGCRCPTPRTTPKLHFLVNKLKIPYIYGKSVIIWSKRVRHPAQIDLAANYYDYCKKNHIDLINIKDGTIN